MASALAALFLASCGSDPEDRIERIYSWKASSTPDSLARIRGYLKDEDRDVRATALYALISAAVPDAVQLGLGALEDEDGFVRATAAKGLGELRASSTLEALASHLGSDPDWHVRQRAAESLAAMGDPGATEPLARGLEDPVREVRLAAVRGSADLDPAASMETLARIVLDDPDWEIRAEAARALGLSHRPEAAAALEAVRSDPNEFVRAAAHAALRRVRQAAAPPATSPDPPGGAPPAAPPG